MPKIDLASLAGMVQQYISRKYAAALIDRTKVAELKAYIAQYANVPVEVLLNGTVIYSTTVNFSAYGVQNIVFTLNVGASLGTQTLVARINWADHGSETRTGNNSVSTTFTVKKVVETSTSTVSVDGEYTEGSQVISSFYVNNEGSSDVLPEDNVSFDFLVYYLDGGKVKTVSQQTWDKVVIPANGRNLVYFKWTVPADSAGMTLYCKGTVSSMCTMTSGKNS